MPDPIETIGDDLYVDNLPDVSEHAIDAARDSDPAPTTKSTPPGFDPAIHAVNEDGTPRLLSSGGFAKKRGRKSGVRKSTINTSTGQTQDKQLSGQPPGTNYEAVGQSCAALIFTLGTLIGGDEWAPRVDDKIGVNEWSQMCGAWENYARAKQMADVPPGVALITVMVAYIAPRFMMPKTNSRAKLAWAWVKTKFSRKKSVAE